MIGRFFQEDVYRGDGLNLYAYCANNPVMCYDPSGYVGLCPKGRMNPGKDEGEREANDDNNCKWGNKETLDDHYTRHGDDVGATGATDYAKKRMIFTIIEQIIRSK